MADERIYIFKNRPPAGQRILVFTDTDDSYLVVWACGRFWFEAGKRDTEIRGRVTHWIPVPEFPPAPRRPNEPGSVPLPDNVLGK